VTVVVFVHSLGSIWQVKAREIRRTFGMEHDGIDDGKRIRPRSRVYGQVAFGRRAQVELNKPYPFRPSAWVTSGLNEHANSLKLFVRASANAVPDWYLVTVNQSLIGGLQDDCWDASETQLVSHSHWQERQEMMLLMRPFGWLKSQFRRRRLSQPLTDASGELPDGGRNEVPAWRSCHLSRG
jgi:hypothetical protein